jgi:hypothetical protein
MPGCSCTRTSNEDIQPQVKQPGVARRGGKTSCLKQVLWFMGKLLDAYSTQAYRVDPREREPTRNIPPVRLLG